MNRNQFEKAAKLFRAGRLTLEEFSAQALSSKRAENSSTESRSEESEPHQKPEDLKSFFDRRPDSHKGDYGRCLISGGSQNMPGAVALAGLAALRFGAGLVRIASVENATQAAQHFEPCLMTFPLQADGEGLINESVSRLEDQIEWADCIAIGPGLGQSNKIKDLVAQVIEAATCPLVIDADGLNAIAPLSEQARLSGNAVLTPHPGECQRLFPQCGGNRDSMKQACEAHSREFETTFVLKGHETLVIRKGDASKNSTGNPGMATAGSGDVLTGCIASLLAQGIPAKTAVPFAVQIHGLAGDLGAEKLGQASLIATDILQQIPTALEKYRLEQGF